MKRDYIWLFFIAGVLFVAALVGAHAQAQTHLHNSTYDVKYDAGINSPLEVRWLITPASLVPRVARSNIKFRSDTRLPRPRVLDSDFTRSGYQRGHLCPAADRTFSLEAMRETFLLSNISPQSPKLNMGLWKSTEVISRGIATTYGRCSVVAGPIFFDKNYKFIGKNRVAVPDAFFKVSWCPGRTESVKIWCIENK